MKKTFFISLLLMTFLTYAQTNITWVDWQTIQYDTPNTGTITGTLSLQNGTVINVTYQGDIHSSITRIDGNVPLSGNGAWWAGLRGATLSNTNNPYLGTDVPNSPASTGDIIAQTQGPEVVNTITFSQPINDAFMSVVSLNKANHLFNRNIEVVSFGEGYWGDGSLSVDNFNTLESVDEGHGTIKIPGNFSSFSFQHTTAETWTGFQIGVLEEGIAIPEPKLEVVKFDSEIKPNCESEYRIEVTNTGTDVALTATVRDLLPDHITYVSTANPDWNCAISTSVNQLGELVCNYQGAGIPASGSSFIDIQVSTDDLAGITSLTNHASVDPTGGRLAPIPALCIDKNLPFEGCAAPITTPVTDLPCNEGCQLFVSADTTICLGDTASLSIDLIGCTDSVIGDCQSAPLPTIDCSVCSRSISGNGNESLSNGDTVCILSGSSFTGNLNLNGGLLIVCGELSPSNVNFNSGSITILGEATFSNLNMNNSNSVIQNFGTLTLGNITFNGTIENNATMTALSHFNVNTQASFINNGTFNAQNNFHNNGVMLNNGPLSVDQDLKNNSNALFTNNCSITVGAQFHNNHVLYNNGSISVITKTYLNSNSTLHASAGSSLTTEDLHFNGTISGDPANCSLVSVANYSELNSSGTFTGVIDYCDANGIEAPYNVNYTFPSNVSTNCSCTTNSFNGVSQLLLPTIVWSPSAGLDNPTSNSPLASPSVTTTYTATVTRENGVVHTETVTITVDENCCESLASNTNLTTVLVDADLCSYEVLLTPSFPNNIVLWYGVDHNQSTTLINVNDPLVTIDQVDYTSVYAEVIPNDTNCQDSIFVTPLTLEECSDPIALEEYEVYPTSIERGESITIEYNTQDAFSGRRITLINILDGSRAYGFNDYLSPTNSNMVNESRTFWPESGIYTLKVYDPATGTTFISQLLQVK